MVKEKTSKKSDDKQKKRKSEGAAKKKPRRKKRAVATDSAAVKSSSASAKVSPKGKAAASTITEFAPMEEDMSFSQCVVWRLGEFRQRVRQAVADWASESPSSIFPTNTLGELAKGTPWNTGQQAQLVQAVNANRIFEPPFPGTVMNPPEQLLPASTTVLQWEAEVWSRQNPITPCLAFTD